MLSSDEAWRSARVSPKADLIVVSEDSATLAVRPGRRAVLLEDVHALLCASGSGGARLGGLVDELVEHGFPRQDDALALLANAAAALAAAGLADVDVPEVSTLPASPVPGSAARSSRTVPVIGAGRTPRTSLERRPAMTAMEWPRRPDERIVAYRTISTADGPVVVEARSDLAALVAAAGVSTHSTPPRVASARTVTIRLLARDSEQSTFDVLIAGRPIALPSGSTAADALAWAIGSVVDVDPDDAVRCSTAWIMQGAEGCDLLLEVEDLPVPAGAVWVAPIWLARNGREVVVLDGRSTAAAIDEAGAGHLDAEEIVRWRRMPLRSVACGNPGRAAERAASFVDAVHPDDPLRLASVAALSVRLAASGKLVGGPIRRPKRSAVEMPASIASFRAVGALEPHAWSAKISAGAVRAGRGSWMLALDRGVVGETADEAARTFAAFGLPEDVARLVTGLPGHDGEFYLGVDPDPSGGGERRKVYIDIARPDTWDALLEAFPGIDELSDDSVVSPGFEMAGPPRSLAFKWRTDRPGFDLSIYREHHDPEVTIAEAIDRVLPGFSDWVAPIRSLVETGRPLDDSLGTGDFEVIEDNGRHSVDVRFPLRTARGERIVPTREMAELAGLKVEESERWARLISRSPVSNVVFGVVGESGPFVGFYAP
jgi:hypothetical protein